MNTPELSHHWLPFTANRAFAADPRVVVSAEGVHYVDTKGRRLLDGISGLFCVPAGHGRPEIAAAVSEQLRHLDFAPTFQFAHPAGFALAEKLSDILPSGLDRVFFVNSGSEAVETALKGALAYHRARGEAGRTRFVGRERAYHGVNFGGLSVGGLVKNREMFGPGLPGVSHMRATWTPEQAFGWGQPNTGAELAEDLQRAIDLYGGASIAAVIVEPIAGSSGGVIVPPEGYLERLAQIAAANGILLIFDEVITGFGRTGHAFASQAFGITPDIMTMAKALTNGAVPMGAVAFRRAVFDAVIEAGSPEGVEFPHGYTWSAHPLACAAALTTLKIYQDENLFDRAARLSVTLQEAVSGLKGAGPISDIRGYGLFAGVELEPDGPLGHRGFQALKAMFAGGLIARLSGDTIILAPPFVATEGEIGEMVEIVRTVVGAL
jgi:beta-alanine--pyruvate transaminase